MQKEKKEVHVKTGEILIKSVVELIILYRFQFP